MAKFTPKRKEQILAQMIARVVARSQLSDVSDTSAWKHVLAAAAREDDELYYQLSLMLALFSIDSARDEDLDERAKDIQPAVIQRIVAQRAIGTVVFSRVGTTGTIVIPVGTRIKTQDGQACTTTTTGTITATSAEQVTGHGVGRDSNLVSVLADAAGAAGNVSAGTVVRFGTKPAGVDQVQNLTSFSQGRDKESDPDFRKRLKDFVKGLARCTPQAMEAGLVGRQDPITSGTILFAKVVEDLINRGNVTVYVDDGTGQAEAIADAATPLTQVLTWDSTTTVLTPTTAGVVVGDWIRLDSDGQWFEVDVVTLNTSYTILNPGADTIPTGATPSSLATDILTEGLSLDDEAVGGETTLFLDNFPVKSNLPVQLASDVNGNLVQDTDYILNPASGQVDFLTALVTDEQIVAGYTYFTGLLAFAQKIVDGDPTDRVNFPGLRAAGVLVRVLSPQILIQAVTAIVTVQEGFDQDTVLAAVRQAIKDYINTLTISGDVIRARLFERIMRVTGVQNVLIQEPVDDVIVLDDQLARTQDSNVVLT